MLDKLKTDSSLEITILKSKEHTITVANSGKLGLDLVCSDEREYLVIRDILDGSVKTHNAHAGLDQQIGVGARILAVGGTRGKGKTLLEQMKVDGSLELVVSQAAKWNVAV